MLILMLTLGQFLNGDSCLFEYGTQEAGTDNFARVHGHGNFDSSGLIYEMVMTTLDFSAHKTVVCKNTDQFFCSYPCQSGGHAAISITD